MLTLKQFKSRTVINHRDLTKVPMDKVATALKLFDSKVSKLKYGGGAPSPQLMVPEHEALWFYLGNHAMAVIQRSFDPAEPIPEPYAQIVRDYYHDLDIRVLRMYGYLMRICTRETRHSHTDHFMKDYPALSSYYLGYKGTGSSSAVNALLEKVPAVPQGVYTRFLQDAFYKGSYNGGFGGKAWGAIADVLKQFVHGEITGEIMLDTAFTLCHNNGPIFNKGMLYSGYTLAALQELLDVQRAGMIPGLVQDVARHQAGGCTMAAHYNSQGFVTPAMVEFCETMSALSTDFSGTVVWPNLKKLGAVFSHDSKIKAFVTKHGNQTSKKEELANKKAAEQAAALKAAQWQILPGVFATKTKPVRATA